MLANIGYIEFINILVGGILDTNIISLAACAGTDIGTKNDTGEWENIYM